MLLLVFNRSFINPVRLTKMELSIVRENALKALYIMLDVSRLLLLCSGFIVLKKFLHVFSSQHFPKDFEFRLETPPAPPREPFVLF